jgi:hypothetical protein
VDKKAYGGYGDIGFDFTEGNAKLYIDDIDTKASIPRLISKQNDKVNMEAGRDFATTVLPQWYASYGMMEYAMEEYGVECSVNQDVTGHIHIEAEIMEEY